MNFFLFLGECSPTALPTDPPMTDCVISTPQYHVDMDTALIAMDTTLVAMDTTALVAMDTTLVLQSETVIEKHQEISSDPVAIETEEPYKNILALSCEPMKQIVHPVYEHHHGDSQNRQNWSVII